MQAQVLNLLAELRRNTRVAFVMISHDLEVIRLVTDRVHVITSARSSKRVTQRRCCPHRRTPIRARSSPRFPRPIPGSRWTAFCSRETRLRRWIRRAAVVSEPGVGSRRSAVRARNRHSAPCPGRPTERLPATSRLRCWRGVSPVSPAPRRSRSANHEAEIPELWLPGPASSLAAVARGELFGAARTEGIPGLRQLATLGDVTTTKHAERHTST